MTKQKATTMSWILNQNNGISGSHETVLTRLTHEGNWPGEDGEFIVTVDMNVYKVFPLLNLINGDVEELWLTKEQTQNYRESARAIYEHPPHERMFELPKIGITKKHLKSPIEGHSTGTIYSLIRDKGGHWWNGSLRDWHTKPYMHSFGPRSKKPPELRFLYPSLRYIGPDADEMWFPRWRDSSEKTRITICTYEVWRTIEAQGMQDVYYPRGKEQHDVELAIVACAAMKASLMANIIDDENSATNLLKDAEKDGKAAWARAHEAEATLSELEAELVEARAIDPSEMDVRVKAAERERDEALQRATKAEEALETARETNQGWDWSRVLGD